MQVIWIILLGGLGVGLRASAVYFIPSGIIPWSILLVNSLGSLAAGMIFARWETVITSQSSPLISALLIGLLGGFTTFSSYSLDTVRLISSGQYLPATLNFLLNNFCTLTLCYLGFRCFR
jgi:CrcB protein